MSGDDERVPACRDEAEASFLRAIAVARAQGARSLELRAASRLARLWQRGGRLGEATQVRSDVFEKLAKGLNTGDLRQARELPDALASNGG